MKKWKLLGMYSYFDEQQLHISASLAEQGFIVYGYFYNLCWNISGETAGLTQP